MAIKKIGRYKIQQEIGRGGMGVVYKAYDPVIERTVALKMINFQAFTAPSKTKELKIRLKREVKVVGKLTHPNIVTVYDVVEKGNAFCIVMEYVEGETLDKVLDREKTISLEQATKIVRDVCNALEYAHKEGIVHRDVKPANIIIAEAGIPKLMDFGIAKLADSTLTRTGESSGTPSYSAPEMIKGEKVGRQADIFSLGCVFYEMITGKKAFPGENITPIMYKVLEEEPRSAVDLQKDLPSAVDAVISKALAKNPEERYQSAGAFARDLETLLEHPEIIPVGKKKKRIALKWLIPILGAGIVGAFIAILAISLIPPLFREEVSSIEWVENTLFAKDSTGKDVWQIDFDAEIEVAVVDDINSDGKNEVVVGTSSKSSSKSSFGEMTGRIYLLNAKGREIWRVNAGVNQAYRKFDDRYRVVSLHVEDLNTDGYKDILSTASRAPWFPTRLMAQYGSKDLKIRHTLDYWHPGSMAVRFIEDINKDGRKDLICAGTNNDLGSKQVIFAIRCDEGIGQAPPWRGNIGQGLTEIWFVILGGRHYITSIEKFENEIFKIGTSLGELFIDFDGNILDSQEPLSSAKKQKRARIRKGIYENWLIASEFVRNEDYELAISRMKEAIKLRGDNPYLVSVLHLELGHLYSVVNQYDNAIAEYKKSLEIDPRCYYTYTVLGERYWAKEKYRHAIKLYIRAFALLGDSWEGGWIYRKLIDSYILDGDVGKAEELCERKRIFGPKSFIVPSKVGEVYTSVGRFKDAVKVYEQCLALDSVNAYSFVFEGLAKAYAYLDTNLHEAETMIMGAIRDNPKPDSIFAGVLGWIYYKKANMGEKDFNEALNEVNKSITYYSNLYSEDPTVRPVLAELYFFIANISQTMGNPDDAEEYYKKCLQLNRGNTYIKTATRKALEFP